MREECIYIVVPNFGCDEQGEPVFGAPVFVTVKKKIASVFLSGDLPGKYPCHSVFEADPYSFTSPVDVTEELCKQ